MDSLSKLHGNVNKAIYEAGHYEFGARHDIVQIPDSKWRVVDSWYDPETDDLLGLGIHYDDDDPNADWASPDDFKPLADAKKLSEDYNAIFLKAYRLARVRATSIYSGITVPLEKHYRAVAYKHLAAKIRKEPNRNHHIIYGNFMCGYVPNV